MYSFIKDQLPVILSFRVLSVSIAIFGALCISALVVKSYKSLPCVSHASLDPQLSTEGEQPTDGMDESIEK